ncbi:MAG: terminase small subunit [Streptococcaceae bacterium]|jgi:phage terminase small subunit|nr:terminase small subunit [Streptococcaceae bacterium]
MKMTEKQKKFCDYFIETGNATKSAIFAGYSQKTAKQIGQQNLTKLDLKTYIDERLRQLEDERIADADEVLKFLTSVMRGEVTEPVSILDGEGHQKVVDLKPSVQTRRTAAVDLGKRFALFTDKTELSVVEPPTFVDDLSDLDDS